ncbi:YuzB family protein [Caldibacillus lycopersici]|uniref:YuzB family protein n=1 Tax=Perspicuibacillus lycopersici TaxID=1325689 RepID=A0AAE3IQR9_9BACI|nr:YuzB family protein [Perspicuibacillus lycopersici]MCU9612860.1 YuzB family protein [Perspicuibacillus lycopersici]
MGLFTKKKQTIKVEFCTNNFDRFYNDDALDELEEFIDKHSIKFREMDCLSFCDECECSPYALINHKFIDANTPEELLKKLKEQL